MYRPFLPIALSLTSLAIGCESFDVPLDVVVADGQGALSGLNHLQLRTTYDDGRSYSFVAEDPASGAWAVGDLPPGTVEFDLEGRINDPVTAGNSLVVSTGRVGPLEIGPGTEVSEEGAKVLFTRRDTLGSLSGALDDGLRHHAVAPLPSGGAVSFGGSGADADEGSRTVLRFDVTGGPDSLRFREVGSLESPRGDHAAVVLADGRILIVGTVPMYDPRAGSMVLIDQGSSSALGDARAAATPEIYDPADDSLVALVSLEFEDVTDNLFVRGRHTLTLLDDGRVLVAGGVQFDDDGGFGIYFPGSTLLINSADGTYEAGPNVGANRWAHTATKLDDGRVLIVGGRGVSTGNLVDLGTATLFDPSDDTALVAGSILPPRGEHGAALLPDGRVIVFGGSTDDGAVGLADSWVFEPATNDWTEGPSMVNARWNPGVAVSAGGEVLVCGGANEAGPVRGCEVFAAGEGEGFAPAPDPGNVADERDGTQLVLLGTGDILSVGGVGATAPTLELLLYKP